MVWQDIIISIANLLFAYSLVYQVIRGYKAKKGYLSLQTSLLTTIGLYAVAVAFFTLKLYFSTVTSVFSGTMWLILFVQGLIYKKA